MVDLEVQIEMQDTENIAMGTGETFSSHPQAEIYLDTDKFDGATYYFEVVATNPHATDWVLLELVTSTDDSESEVIILNNQTAPIRKRSSATPNNTYKPKRWANWGGTAAGTLYDARVIVVQSNATKTELQIAIGTNSSGKYTSYPSGGSNFGNGKRKFWYYDSSVFSTSGTITVEMEAIGHAASTSQTWYGCIKLKGGTSAVTNGEVSGTEDTFTRKRNTGGITLSSGSEYEGDFKGSASNKVTYIAAVRLIFRMTATITKIQTYIRCGWEQSVTGGAGEDLDRRRCLWTEDYSGTPSKTYEATGYGTSTDSGNSTQLRHSQTNDSGGGLGSVTGSYLSWGSTTPIRKRCAGSITLTDGYRYLSRIDSSLGQTCYLGHGWIIVSTVVAAVTETIIAKDFPMGYLEKPVKAEQLTSKVEGATVQAYTKNFPRRLVKAGKQKELESEFTA